MKTMRNGGIDAGRRAMRAGAPSAAALAVVAFAGFGAASTPAAAFETVVTARPPVVAAPSGFPLGVTVSGPPRAQIVYVAPLPARVLGVRDAPVGQPVIYVIDAPGAKASGREPQVRRVAP